VFAAAPRQSKLPSFPFKHRPRRRSSCTPEVSVDFAAVSVKSTADAGITVSAMPTMSASVTRGGEGPLRLAVSGIVLPLTHSAAVAQARALVRRAVMGPVSMEPVVAGPAHMALLALISIALFSLTEGLPLASMLPQRLLLS